MPSLNSNFTQYPNDQAAIATMVDGCIWGRLMVDGCLLRYAFHDGTNTWLWKTGFINREATVEFANGFAIEMLRSLDRRQIPTIACFKSFNTRSRIRQLF